MTAEMVPEFNESDPVADALDLIEAAVAMLSTSVPERLDDDESTEGTVALLHRLVTLRKALGTVEAVVEQQAAWRCDYGTSEVGEWTVVVRGGKNRVQWRNDDLAYAACLDIALDKSTGEVDRVKARVVDEVRSRLMNVFGGLKPRTTMLKELGIEPDDFCVSDGTSRRTVQVEPRVVEL